MAGSDNFLKRMKTADAIEVMNNLKNYGLLSLTLTLKICKQVESQITKMSGETLAIYLMIFSSDHTKNAYEKSRQESEYNQQNTKISKRLEQLSTNLDAETFGQIATGLDEDVDNSLFL